MVPAAASARTDDARAGTASGAVRQVCDAVATRRDGRDAAHARSRTQAPTPNTHANEEAERLVMTYADLILRLSYTYLHTTADAEDICQDVLLKLMQREGAFDSQEHERAWVIRVTVNACKDILRRERAHPAVTLDSLPEQAAPAAIRERDARARQSQVLAAVLRLPEGQRAAIYLHYYEGYSIRSIAELTSSTPAAVAQRLSRGRKQLRTLLKGAIDDDELDV